MGQRKMEVACVVFNNVHVDIMDYTKPAWCNEAQVHCLNIASFDLSFFDDHAVVTCHVDRF